MKQVIGYVIVRDFDQKLFVGYRHPGTRAVGYPVWTLCLDGLPKEGGKAAIYREVKDAVGIANSLYLRDYVPCTVHPVILDRDLTAAEDAWLAEVQDYLQQNEDVKDGEDGQPQPNTAMSLLQEMQRLGLTKDSVEG